MQWMFVISGLAAGVAAVALLGAWRKKSRRATKGEVSQMATVKRVSLDAEKGPIAQFVSDGQEFNFTISKEFARQLVAGQRGVLTYQGHEFVYFVPREEMFPKTGGQRLPQVS